MVSVFKLLMVLSLIFLSFQNDAQAGFLKTLGLKSSKNRSVTNGGPSLGSSAGVVYGQEAEPSSAVSTQSDRTTYDRQAGSSLMGRTRSQVLQVEQRYNQEALRRDQTQIGEISTFEHSPGSSLIAEVSDQALTIGGLSRATTTMTPPDAEEEAARKAEFAEKARLAAIEAEKAARRAAAEIDAALKAAAEAKEKARQEEIHAAISKEVETAINGAEEKISAREQLEKAREERIAFCKKAASDGRFVCQYIEEKQNRERSYRPETIYSLHRLHQIITEGYEYELNRLRSLTTLHIHGPSNAAIGPVLAWIGENCLELEELDLQSLDLWKNHIEALGEKLPEDSKLTRLILRDNLNLGDQGITALTNYFGFRNLKVLDVSNTGFGTPGLLQLTYLGQLKKLDISRNRPSTYVSFHYSRFARAERGLDLEALSVQENNLNNGDIKLLIDNFPHLKVLNASFLSGSIRLGMFGSMKNLECLFLDGDQIDQTDLDGRPAFALPSSLREFSAGPFSNFEAVNYWAIQSRYEQLLNCLPLENLRSLECRGRINFSNDAYTAHIISDRLIHSQLQLLDLQGSTLAKADLITIVLALKKLHNLGTINPNLKIDLRGASGILEMAKVIPDYLKVYFVI